MVQLTRDNQTVYCELDHIDNYDLKELIFYTDAWCEKLMENIRKKESLLARLLIDKIAKQYLKKSIFQLGFTIA